METRFAKISRHARMGKPEAKQHKHDIGSIVTLLGAIADPRAKPLKAVASSPVFEVTRLLPAEALGLRGDERPLELDADAGFKSAVESIREQIAFAVSANLGEAYCPQQVKVAIIGSIRVTADIMVKSVTSRVINRYKTHKAYPVSGAICLSAAGVIPGTVVHELLGQTDAPSTLHIVHPTGTMAVSTSFEIAHGQCKITQSVVNRSARVLMQGVAYAYVEDEMMDYRRLSGDERIISPASMQS